MKSKMEGLLGEVHFRRAYKSITDASLKASEVDDLDALATELSLGAVWAVWAAQRSLHEEATAEEYEACIDDQLANFRRLAVKNRADGLHQQPMENVPE